MSNCVYIMLRRTDLSTARLLCKNVVTLLLVLVLLLQDLHSHIIDGSVVKHDKTAVGTRLDVDSLVLAILVVDASEVVAYRLYCHIELVSYAMCRAIGQTVFESAELIEGDGFAHLVYIRD